jgi:hypothetical protein
MAAQFPLAEELAGEPAGEPAGKRCSVMFRTLWIQNRCDFAWVLSGANQKSVGGGGGGNSAGRIR